ncbi:MAG: histidine--tRNA ligase [Spirochaetales bacterium]|nr:histidine--tRNA ligase [Spirochaetales bacterium]
MASIIEPRVLKGFRDFLPPAEIKRKEIQRILEGTFENFGFVPIDTPALEYRDVLLGKGGGETDKQVYAFQDNGGRDVSLRFDLTVPFARFLAAHRNELYLPFKRYHIAKVWRGENTQKGRYREFTQCDFDIVGPDSASADFEIIFMMYTSMKALGVENFIIHISHRGIFNAFLEHNDLKGANVEILRAVDKIAKIGADEVKKILEPVTGGEMADKILDFIKAETNWQDTLKKLTELVGGENEHTLRMESLFKLATETGISEALYFDPSITRGLDYYTGVVYETFLKDIPRIGSVCSGGRYNNLAGLYTKEELPGVGSSIGLDRLIAALEELDMLSTKESLSRVLILNMDDSLMGYYFSMASKLREKNISTELYLEKKKLKNQFSFAEKKNIPFALICGEDEYKNGTVNIKNLTTRESFNNIGFDEAIKLIQA